MPFGQPSFGGVYGGRLGADSSSQSQQTGGPDYTVSNMSGGTGGAAPTAASADVTQAGLLGHPLSWWILIFLILVGMSLLGSRK